MTTPRSSREAPWSRLLFLLPDAERREDLVQDRLVDVLSGDFADGMKRRADGGRQQVLLDAHGARLPGIVDVCECPVDSRALACVDQRGLHSAASLVAHCLPQQ